MKKFCVVLCLLCGILLCGCSSEQIKEDEMYVYFINTEGNALITEVHPLMGVEETLNLLVKPAEKNVTVLGDVGFMSALATSIVPTSFLFPPFSTTSIFCAVTYVPA